jgi:quercetin dioxygenase-like cupin family protein
MPIPKPGTKLPELAAMTKKLKGTTPMSSVVEYEVEGGTAVGHGLMHDHHGAVQKCLFSKGTKLPCHQHERAQEWLIVLSGRLEVVYAEAGEKKTEVLERGDFLYLDKETGHGALALEDTWILGVVVPSIDGYPGAPGGA